MTNTPNTPDKEPAPNFIQWMGDNQYEVESFCGRSLEEDEDCPDILLIPCGFKMDTKQCDLGMYIIKDGDGYFQVEKNPNDFRIKNN